MYRHQVSFLSHWLSWVISEIMFHPTEVYRVEIVATHIESCNVPYPFSISSRACTRRISVAWAMPLLNEPDPPSHWLHSELSAKISHPKAFWLPCERGLSHPHEEPQAGWRRLGAQAPINVTPWPRLWYTFIISVHRAIKLGGADPFPWPRPMKESKTVPPNEISLSPNAVSRYHVMVLSTYSIIATITLQTLKLWRAILAHGWATASYQWPSPHFLLPLFCVVPKLCHRRDLMLLPPLLPAIPFLQTLCMNFLAMPKWYLWCHRFVTAVFYVHDHVVIFWYPRQNIPIMDCMATGVVACATLS